MPYIGKTKITVRAEGCIRCGIENSSGWRVLKTVSVKVGRSEWELPIYICADCDKKEPKQPVQMSFLEVQNGDLSGVRK